MKHLLALACAALLAACAAAPAPTGTAASPALVAAAPADPITQAMNDIGKVTLKDLADADAEAVAGKDALGHACWPALSRFVTENAPTPLTANVSGAFSAWEAARVARLGLQSKISAGLPNYLKLGCAPLLMDEQQLLIKLGLVAAGTSVGAPLLPALGAALPIPIQ